MSPQPTRVSCEIGGRTLILETGQVARQAHGSVIATYGETKTFAAVCTGAARDDIDFFPLTCDYREKTESAGKIPGGFFKREGRPTTKEVLTMRMIDRSIRPMFPKGFRQEVQVMSHVLSYDGVSNPDVIAMVAAFAAVHISSVPFQEAMGAVRMGFVDGQVVVNPTDQQRKNDSRLDLMVAGHKDGLAMVEAHARELPEEDVVEALATAEKEIAKIVALVDQLRDEVGKPKDEFVPPAEDTDLVDAVGRYRDALAEAQATAGKHERSAAVDAVKTRCVEELTASVDDDRERMKRAKAVKGAFGSLNGQLERELILGGTRIDGRAHDEIREITIVPDFVPRQHGSVLFTRGETQALVSTTLGTPEDEQIIDGIEEEYKKPFYLHYNFPPYSVGETRRFMGPGRREIGHGMLAERALTAVLPPRESFPYTIRIVSDIMESNGSSSMASVCGGCLAMMRAGVPLTQPVAGIAMGLVQDGERTAILSDILGSEDHNGDMDFKVAGSGIGITALQMDIKIRSVSRDLLERALRQAWEGRRYILRKMLEVVSRPEAQVSDFAPRMERIKIPSDRIGFLIGPGGRNIKGLQETYKVRVSILDDEGNVQVSGLDKERVEGCVNAIQASCETPEIGSRYKGTVKGVKDFGAFIEILPGVEGMCHISELSDEYVGKVTDVIDVGDEVEVVVINVDDRGKIKLSHRQALASTEA